MQVLVEVLSLKARSVASEEMLRECMKVAANAWALSAALDGLDDWTIQQARPEWAAPQVGHAPTSRNGRSAPTHERKPGTQQVYCGLAACAI
jgi:hypothetical protein